MATHESAAIYTFYADNVAKLADISIETGSDPDDDQYGPSSLVDDNPAKYAKIDSTTGAWLLEFDSPQPVAMAALIHHTFDETVGSPSPEVWLEGNATDSWASPSFRAQILIPAWLGAGESAWPVNPWLDLTVQPGYNPNGFIFWRLSIIDNSQNIQLGQLILSSVIRQMYPDRQWEYVTGQLRRKIDNRTEFGVSTIYSRFSPQWNLEGGHRVDDDFRELLDQHWHEVDGAGFPWLYIPDADQNRCYMVRFKEPSRSSTHVIFDVNDYTFAVEEVARGLRPGV